MSIDYLLDIWNDLEKITKLKMSLTGNKKAGWLIKRSGMGQLPSDYMALTHHELLQLQKLINRKLSTTKLNGKK